MIFTEFSEQAWLFNSFYYFLLILQFYKFNSELDLQQTLEESIYSNISDE